MLPWTRNRLICFFTDFGPPTQWKSTDLISSNNSRPSINRRPRIIVPLYDLEFRRKYLKYRIYSINRPGRLLVKYSEKTPSSGKSLIRIYSLKWVGWGWALIWVWLGGRGSGRLFEAERLLTFSTFRMGAYSRWALIRGWALIRINTVICG